MSQHDYVIANDTAPNVRADINDVLLAISSNNSGASAPATMYANQWWYDSTNDILKIRSEANDAWISVATLNQTSKQFFPIVGGVSVTATGTEINKLAGLATTAVELGYVTGVTSAIQTQLGAKAALASPTFTGTPLAPTATAGTNTTQIATTAFVLANVSAAASMTLLGTLTTTSGASQTLSGLTLTSYKQILAVFKLVSSNASSGIILGSGIGLTITDNGAAAAGICGTMLYDLTNGILTTNASAGIGVGSTNQAVIGSAWAAVTNSSITTASTSITFSSAGTFDGGSILIYWVK